MRIQKIFCLVITAMFCGNAVAMESSTQFDFIHFDDTQDDEQKEKINNLLTKINNNPVGEKLLEFISEDIQLYKDKKQKRYKQLREDFEYSHDNHIDKILIKVGKETSTTRLSIFKRYLNEREQKKIMPYERGDQIVITLSDTLLREETHVITSLGKKVKIGREIDRQLDVYECGQAKLDTYFILAHELIHVLHILQDEKDYRMFLQKFDTSLWPIYADDDLERVQKIWPNLEEQRTVIGIQTQKVTSLETLSELNREQISDYTMRLGIGLNPRYAYQLSTLHFYESSNIIEEIFLIDDATSQKVDDEYVFNQESIQTSALSHGSIKCILN